MKQLLFKILKETICEARTIKTTFYMKIINLTKKKGGEEKSPFTKT